MSKLNQELLDQPIRSAYKNFFETYSLGPWEVCISCDSPEIQVWVCCGEMVFESWEFPVLTTPRKIQKCVAKWAKKQYKKWLKETENENGKI